MKRFLTLQGHNVSYPYQWIWWISYAKSQTYWWSICSYFRLVNIIWVTLPMMSFHWYYDFASSDTVLRISMDWNVGELLHQFVKCYSSTLTITLTMRSYHQSMLVIIFKPNKDLCNIFCYRFGQFIFSRYRKELGNRFVWIIKQIFQLIYVRQVTFDFSLKVLINYRTSFILLANILILLNRFIEIIKRSYIFIYFLINSNN